MARFIAGSDLADAIREVLAGNEVRCAVAFWGNGAEALLHQAAGNPPRIICDVTLGGTSPDALRALGAPRNDRLRHIPSFHPKVYMSDRGAVVGSANASRNGIGLDGPANNIEGSVMLGPGEDSFGDAASWFEMHWKKSEQVDDRALELASKRFRPDRPRIQPQGHPDSLLDLIAADPDRFSDISIVLVKSPTTKFECDQIRDDLKTAYPSESTTIDSLPDNGVFSGWEMRDLNRWRRTFIELWMPKTRLFVYGRKVFYFHDPKGAVMSRTYWRSIQAVVGGQLPTPAQIAKADEKLVRQLVDIHGNRLFSASELAAEIERLSVPEGP